MYALEALFVLSLAWIGYIYLGYPAGLWLIGRLRGFTSNSSEDFTPSVSVLISARNEEKDIGWKVYETLSWNYPPEKLEVLVASDASEDQTDEILRSIADPRLKYTRMPVRVGKNAALNRLFELARGEILFFTDANSHVGRECLRKMTRHFADPRVGCVTGWERTVAEGEDPLMVAGGSAYLGIESLTNSLESRLGSVLVCDGSVFCIRRNLFQKLQPDLANDLQLPIHIGAENYALLYEPEAFSAERATGTPQEEFHRKRRICAQGILGFWRLRKSLHGLRAWQFYSRKLLRWFALIPLVLLLVTSAMLSRNPLFALVFGAQILVYALALFGWWKAVRGQEAGPLISMPLYFVLVNLAAFTGIVEASLGRRFSVWEIPLLSRGPGGSQRAQDAANLQLAEVNGEDRGLLPKHSSSKEKAQNHQARAGRCIFSVDVEDWFHILDLTSTPAVADWDGLPSRVELNFLRLLDIFSEAKVGVTCFFLGWVARKFPHLVREAKRRGHEIASHGYAHQLAYQMGPDKFSEDALVSKQILEDAIGGNVLGYRAAGFSVTDSTEWYFEKLIEAGYRYDSSVFPAPRGHGGMPNGHCDPYRVSTPSGDLLEFPISVKQVLGRPMCFFGGGYLRLFPYSLIKKAATSILEEGRAVTFYVHPREIDPGHPRLPMQLTRRFKSYVNLRTTEPKIRRLLTDFEVTTFRDFISNAPHPAVGFADGSLLETRLAKQEASAH
jgi:polysaccharide deacetylase family protein (PEP-CTERM system associated)